MRIGRIVTPIALLALVAAVLLAAEPAWADRLADAIQESVANGKVDPAAAPGYLGIPGGPTVPLWLAFVWAIWVGWIFSTVGAFGGIMAGFGHITVFGLGGYAKSFGKGTMLNKLVTDSIRCSNQYPVGFSALLSSWNYYKMGRLILPLGISLGIGSIAGASLVPYLTAGKVNLSSYVGYFGLFVLALGAWLFYETTPAGLAKKKSAAAAAKAFQDSVKKQREGAQVDLKAQGVKVVSFSMSKVVFTFFGVEFSFNPIIPVIGGFVISSIAAFLGVGGGFLLVPYLTSVAGLPMYLVAGTSALAVFISMVTSISSYMIQGTLVDWAMLGAELVGIFIGSYVGPKTSKYIPDVWLKRIFIILALYIGIKYTIEGFVGIKLPI